VALRQCQNRQTKPFNTLRNGAERRHFFEWLHIEGLSLTITFPTNGGVASAFSMSQIH